MQTSPVMRAVVCTIKANTVETEQAGCSIGNNDVRTERDFLLDNMGGGGESLKSFAIGMGRADGICGDSMYICSLGKFAIRHGKSCRKTQGLLALASVSVSRQIKDMCLISACKGVVEILSS